MTLTPKQSAFVDEYLLDLNCTQAAIRAGYSERTAYSQGQRLLKNVEVAAALQEAMAARSERTQIDADWVLKRLRDEAEADIADIYDDDGELLPERDWPLVWRQGVGKVSDRIKRLELIGKHVDVRAFVERKEVTGKDGAALESRMVFIPVGPDHDDAG